MSFYAVVILYEHLDFLKESSKIPPALPSSYNGLFIPFPDRKLPTRFPAAYIDFVYDFLDSAFGLCLHRLLKNPLDGSFVECLAFLIGVLY